jgi:hypothetical protein
VNRIGPWLPRAGAALAAAGFFLPHHTFPGQFRSPFGLCLEMGAQLPLAETIFQGLWLVATVAVPLLLLAALLRRGPDEGGLPGVLLVLLLASAFALSTLGSIRMTVVPDPGGAQEASEGLSLALFALPLVCAAVAVGRVLGGGDRKATDRMVRASLGLLIALHGLFFVEVWTSAAGPTARAWGGLLPTAWSGVAGGLLILLGELQALARSGDPAPAAAKA